MVITIVRDQFDRVHTLSDAWDAMRLSASQYENVPGLLRKYCLLGDDGIATGGVYVWRSREAAESYFAEHRPTGDRRGGSRRPSIEYFRVPVVIGDDVITSLARGLV